MRQIENVEPGLASRSGSGELFIEMDCSRRSLVTGRIQWLGATTNTVQAMRSLIPSVRFDLTARVRLHLLSVGKYALPLLSQAINAKSHDVTRAQKLRGLHS
jgi:hypothetical protein